MTEQRLYELAHNASLSLWAKERRFLDKHPDNIIANHWESKYWEELMELETVMKAKGYGYSTEK